MALLQHMTPEGLEHYLLLDGAVVSMEELRSILTQSHSSTAAPEMNRFQSQSLRQSPLEVRLPILRVVHVRSAR